MHEARATSLVNHPNVVQILDLGTDGSSVYIVQEFLDGNDLARELRQRGPMTERAIIEVMAPVAAGLAAIHAAGVIHRDLKPENIFLSRTSTGEIVPKIIDLGIARPIASAERENVTREGTVIGSPEYMSPEQVRGRAEIDGRADLWSLGVIVFELFVGRTLFGGNSIGDTFLKIISEPIPRLKSHVDASSAIDELVHRSLQRDPAERVASAAEWLATLLDNPDLRSEEWFAALRHRYRSFGVFGGSSTVGPSSPPPSASGSARPGARRTTKTATPPPSAMSIAATIAPASPPGARRRLISVAASAGTISLAAAVLWLWPASVRSREGARQGGCMKNPLTSRA